MVTTATLPVHCRSSCGRRLLSAPDQIEASWEPTHTRDMPDGVREYRERLIFVGVDLTVPTLSRM